MMKGSRRVRELLAALSAQWVALGLTGLISLLLTSFIARSLGPELFGSYSIAITAGSLLVILIDGGLRSLVFREISCVSEHLVLVRNDLMGLVSGHVVMVSGLCLILALFFLDVFGAVGPLIVVWATVIALTQIGSSVLRGRGEFLADAKFQVIARAGSAAAIVAVAYGSSLTTHSAILAWLAAGGLFLLFNRRLFSAPKVKSLGLIYRSVVAIFLTELLIWVYLRSNLFFLNYFEVPDSDVGMFAASFRVCEVFVMLAGPVGLLIFRSFRGGFGQAEPEKRARLEAQVILYGAAVGIAFAAATFFSSRLILSLLYGTEYLGGGDILEILSLMIIFIFPNMILTQFAFANNLVWEAAATASVGAFVSLALNYFVVPSYGISGAAWAVGFSELAVFVTLILFLLRRSMIGPMGR